MNLAAAETYIASQIRRIDAVYLRPMFDEWAVIGFGEKGSTDLAYHGPRRETYRARLAVDTQPLRSAMAKRDYQVGDFEFALQAAGAGYDACMKIGPASYLICNNLNATMDELRKDPQWLKVQPIWFEIAEKFRADPLT